jgi:hypothetical protein
MQFRLRTLVLLTAIVPPLLWGAYLVLSPPGRFFSFACFVLAALICLPMVVFRLYVATRMK